MSGETQLKPFFFADDDQRCPHARFKKRLGQGYARQEREPIRSVERHSPVGSTGGLSYDDDADGDGDPRCRAVSYRGSFSRRAGVFHGPHFMREVRHGSPSCSARGGLVSSVLHDSAGSRVREDRT
jgi:hypothetical protein